MESYLHTGNFNGKCVDLLTLLNNGDISGSKIGDSCGEKFPSAEFKTYLKNYRLSLVLEKK